MEGFIQFIREQGVVGLAIGFILGGAVSSLVNSIVEDLINPLLGLILGAAGDLSTFTIQIGSAQLLIGSLMMAVVDFMAIAAVVYLGFKYLHLDKLDAKKGDESAKKK